MSAKPVCFNWKESQACKFGNTCRFAHLDQDGNLQYDGPITAEQTCFAFRDTGKCQFGARCRFVHVDKDGDVVAASVDNAAPAPARRAPRQQQQAAAADGAAPAPRRRAPKAQKDNTCWAFNEGNCEYGEKCRFKHGQEDARDLQAARREARGPCWQFRDGGDCRYGDNCVFQHIEA